MSEASLEVNTRYRNDLEEEKARLLKDMDRLKGKVGGYKWFRLCSGDRNMILDLGKRHPGEGWKHCRTRLTRTDIPFKFNSSNYISKGAILVGVRQCLPVAIYGIYSLSNVDWLVVGTVASIKPLNLS